MSHRHKELESFRTRIDEIDTQILDLLAERAETVRQVIRTKIDNQLPVFVPAREQEKSDAFKALALERGIKPEWAEDFLRLIMSSSRDSQSQAKFPIATSEPKHILYIGGEGGMGKLYKRITEQTGHNIYSIDKGNWFQLEEMTKYLDLVIITVPIHVTESVITRLQGRLSEKTILADFTSNKTKPIKAMLESHSGPVIGLHPMHGPDVENLSKQLMVVCPGRESEKAQWFIKQ